MDVYPTTDPATGDEVYDLLGKWAQALLAAFPSADTSTTIYPSPAPTTGDTIRDRWGKLCAIYSRI